VPVDRSNPDRVLRRYYLFRAMAAVGFVSPIFALFVLRDLSYPEYGTLSAVYSLVLVGGEIPTGYLGDRVGRRDTLVASKVAMALSLLGFVVVDSFASYVVVYVVWGLGMALTSGTGGAWLYEILGETLGEEQFTTVRGKGNAIARWSAAVTTVLGAVLYGLDPTYPFLAAGVLMLAGAGVVATLPRTAAFAGTSATDGPDGAGDDGPNSPSAREAFALLRKRLLRPPLRSFVLFVALLFGVVGAGNGYIQPAAVAVAGGLSLDSVPIVGPLAADAAEAANGGGLLGGRLELSAATGLGPLYASFAAVAAGISYYAGAIESRVGLRRTLVVVAFVVAAAFVVPLAVPLAALGTFYVSQSVQHLLRPMVQQYVNDRTGDAGRATVLSAVSMVFGVARTPFVVLAGFAAGARGPVFAFPALAALLVATALPLALLGSPLPRSEAPGSAADGTPQ
jgi:MFS family permease